MLTGQDGGSTQGSIWLGRRGGKWKGRLSSGMALGSVGTWKGLIAGLAGIWLIWRSIKIWIECWTGGKGYKLDLAGYQTCNAGLRQNASVAWLALGMD